MLDRARSGESRSTESLKDVYRSSDGKSKIGRRRFIAGAGIIGASALITGASAADRVISSKPDQGLMATGNQGVVSTSQPIATEVGAQVLEQGGNAIDAAIAIQFTLSVVEPQSSGLGGGGFMLIYSAEEDETQVINGQVRAPAAASADRFEDEETNIAQSGLAVGAPGTPRMLQTAFDRWGTVNLPDLIAPAVTLAEEGFRVDTELAHAISSDFGRLTPAAKDVFSDDGEPLGQGDILVQADLAETLRTIAAEGIDTFYEGPIADDIASTVQAQNGDLTAEDLANYEITVDAPLESEFNDCRCVASSLPSSGITLLQLLRILDGFDLCKCDLRSAKRYNLFLEASHLAYADMWAHLGDDDFVDVPVEGMLSDDYLDTRRALITPGEANPDIGPGNPAAVVPANDVSSPEILTTESEHTTTHFTVADSAGNVVSTTTTLTLNFGSGSIVPDRGIPLANSLLNFDFLPGGPNAIEPNKRPHSTMSPAIVFRNGRPLLAAGSPGGAKIIAATAQVIINVLEHGLELGPAVAEPRVFSSFYPTVSWEDGVPGQARADLVEMGYNPDDRPMEIGAVQALYTQNNEYVGVADSRRSGHTIALPR